MALTIGTRLGSYVIEAPLGAGGMGEVYRARDTRLGREVAIKVLPAAFSADADRLGRFEQEARAVGILNHPNILTIHDIGTDDGAPYIVSELLEGDTLRGLLAHGRLPVRQALDYALQTARGLVAAHDKGIVHRDLKPENLVITEDGRVKILDFGLAKLTHPKGGDAGAPTMPNTEPGVIMGTVGYMAPEQVRGEDADSRADLFAVGAILYEMLTGNRAFQGPSAIEMMNAILKEEPPDLTATILNLSPALERVVRHCLEKRPADRFQSTRDLSFALESLTALSGANATRPVQVPESTPIGVRRATRERVSWIVAAILLLATLALAVAYVQRAPVAVRAVRSFILPPEKSSFSFVDTNAGALSISPDGRRLTFVAPVAEGKSLLWIRSLDSLSAHALTGTEGASYPFWSPDSRFIGFFAERKLKTIEAAGGPALTLCDAPVARGGTWNRDGVIVFSPDQTGALQQVSASGGAPSAVTKLDEARGGLTDRWPFFLPDGQHFLYLRRGITGSESETDIFVASLASKDSKLLLHASSNVAYAQGYVLFLREGTLMAQTFDVTRLELVGDAFPIADVVQSEPSMARAVFAVSETGVLRTKLDLWVLPLTGNRKPFPFLQTEFNESGGQFSHDGRWIAYVSDESRRNEIYVAPFPGPGGKQRISTSGGRNPTWRSDGTEMFYLAPDNKVMSAEVNSQGTSPVAGAVRPLFETHGYESDYVYDVTADGQRFLVNTAVEQKASAPITLVLNWTADVKR